jgi:hypothetical protein
MQGIDFTEVLTGEGRKNLILAHVELLTPVDPDELPRGLSVCTASESRLIKLEKSRVFWAQHLNWDAEAGAKSFSITVGGKFMTGFQIVPLSEVPMPMSCEEKARLVKEYDDATLAFSDAVQELRRRIGTSPKAEYERLERISSQARVKSEQTRLALEQHIATHRC